MNISQEKAYIQNKMKNILDEQARLIDLHSGLRESLTTLTEMEERGMTEVTLSEYVAFAKSTLEEEIKEEQQKMKLEDKPKYPINNSIRNHMGIRQPIVTEAIIEVLKGQKTPMHLNELFNKTNERLGGQITSLKNFQNNNLQRAMKVTSEIKRAKTKGYYQYNGK